MHWNYIKQLKMTYMMRIKKLAKRHMQLLQASAAVGSVEHLARMAALYWVQASEQPFFLALELQSAV